MLKFLSDLRLLTSDFILPAFPATEKSHFSWCIHQRNKLAAFVISTCEKGLYSFSLLTGYPVMFLLGLLWSSADKLLCDISIASRNDGII